MNDQVQQALEKRKKKREASTVQAALERRKSRLSEQMGTVASDIFSRYQAAVDSYNGRMKDDLPTWGAGKSAAQEEYERNRQSMDDVYGLQKDLRAYRKYLGKNADTMLSDLEEISSGYDSLLNNAKFYSQYASEDEYNRIMQEQAVHYGSDEEAKAALEEIEKKIAENEQRIEELNNQKVSAAPSGKVTGIFNSLVSDKQKEAWESEGNPTMDELLKQRKELEAQQEELKGRYANDYYTVDNRSKLAEIQADEDMSTLYQSAKDLQSDMDKVNAVAADALYHDGGREAAEYKEYLQSKYGLTQEAIDQYVIGGRNANFTDDGYGNIWQLYDELENRLAQTKTDFQSQGYDYDRISGYEQSLADTEAYTQKQKEYQEYATEHPVLSSIDSVLVSPFQGIDYLRYGLDYLENRGHNDVSAPENYVPLNAYTMEATNLVSAIRGTVSQNIEENTDWKLLGQNVGSFLYQTGMSIADSATQVAALGNASILFMGASAASNKTRDILLRGGTNDQAFWGGLAAGAAEAVFEKFSVDQLLKPKAISGWKSVIKETAKQAGVEASEEMATEIANILSDTAIMGNTSEFSESVRGYMNDGMSEEEAKKQAFLDCIGQVVLAGTGGFISGGVMGGGASAINAYNAYSAGKSFDVSTLSEQDINAFIEEGLASAPNTASHQLAVQLREKVDNGGRITNYELGQLYQQNRLAIENELSGDSLPTVFERTVNWVMKHGQSSRRAGADAAAADTVTTTANIPAAHSGTENHMAAGDAAVNLAAADSTPAGQTALTGVQAAEAVQAVPVQTTGEFTASADGQTIDTRTGEAVNIREVATTYGDKMTLRLENGQMVDAGDVAYATADEALLYETVADMGVNAATANALIRGYDTADGVEARVYALGMEEAYRYGKYGIPMQEMSRNGFSAELTETQRQLAYNLGRTDSKYQALQNGGANDRMGTKGDVRNGREEVAVRSDESPARRSDGKGNGRNGQRSGISGVVEADDGRSESTSVTVSAGTESGEVKFTSVKAEHYSEKQKRDSQTGASYGYDVRYVPRGSTLTFGDESMVMDRVAFVLPGTNTIFVMDGTKADYIHHELFHRFIESNYQDAHELVQSSNAAVLLESTAYEQYKKLTFRAYKKQVSPELIFEEIACDLCEYAMSGSEQMRARLDGLFAQGELEKLAEQARKLFDASRVMPKPAKTTGKLHFDGDRSALSARQETSLNALEVVADALGVDIYVYESGTDSSGRRTGANGWYDPKDSSIHLDLYAGANGEGTMLFTAAHELTHFIRQWSPEKFKTFADFLFSEYGKKGVSVDALIRAQMEKAKRNGRTIDYDTAYEEAVADSCETMFTDGSLMERLARLKAADRTLWQKIKDFIDQLVSKIRKAYAGLSPDSAEGKYVAQMQDAAERLQALFSDALEDAGDAHAGSWGQKNTAENGGVKYSINQDFESLYDAWDKTNPRIVFHVGRTSNVLMGLGVPDTDILWDASKIIKIRAKHPEMTDNIIKQVPQILESPIVVMKSKTSDSRITLFGEVFSQNKPILAVLELSPTGRNGVRLNELKVASAYGKDNAQRFINNSQILYVDENKQRTSEWETRTGLQLPVGDSPTDPNTTVSQTDTGVNNQSMQEETKYSDRDYSYEALTSKPDMVVTTLPADVPKNRADVVHAAKQNAAAVGKTNRDGSVTVHVKDIDTDVVISTPGLRHGLDRRFDENAIVTLEAGKILQNSVKINEMTPTRKEAKNSYILIGTAKAKNSELYIIRSVINHFSNELMSMDVLYAINSKKGKPAALNAPGIFSSLTGSTLSIAKLLDYVNEYFPDILPEDVLRHYGHEARPSGRLGESALFSARDPEGSVSNRSLLAGALESAAQNDIERQRLKDYRQKIDEINAEEAKLSAIRAKIRELSFAKGPRDTAQIKQLHDSATRIANRINTFDRQLLRLEASAPLQNVLQREKQRAAKRAEQRGKEALSAYREAAQAKQQAIVERYQQARQKGIESRNKTALRSKIKGIVSELNRLLLHGTKDKHVMAGLQKTTAAALSAVNMDTVNAEKRLAEIQAKIDKATDPDTLAALRETYARIERQGENMKKRLDALRDAYADIQHSPDPLLAEAHQPEIAERINELRRTVGDTSLREMSAEQLEAVYDTYKMVLTTIRNANRTFKAEKGASIETLGGRVMDEMRDAGGLHDKRLKALEGVRSFDWSNLKPVYAFKRIGSSTLSALFDQVRAGEDIWAVDVSEAKTFFREQAQKYGYDDWDFRQRHAFRSRTGKEISLSLDQMLSLYAYSKREQAVRHLEKGGFVLDDAVEVVERKKGIPVKYKVNTAGAYNLSADTLAEITGALTDGQRAFADEMQAYLSDVMGAKGNEVAMTMYGVPLFKEKTYFPIKSARQYMFEENQTAGEVRLKNAGFSKETTAGAGNPMILGSFMDVWSNHVNDMAMYHAFVLPLEDFNRVFNYKTASTEITDTESVKGVLQNAYGSQPVRYIGRLLTDLNGGARTDPVENLAGQMIGRFKKMAVFASLSVVIQQPSAIARAAAYIDPKYFATNPGLRGHSALWEEVKRYAPVAIIKEMGYFDTNVGRRTADWMTAKEYDGFGEKAKALVTDSGYRDEVLSKAPALADELAWCYVWNAVKKETAAATDLQPGSEAFMKRAGERFTEVIVNTQVYDSVLSRSEMMRSKGALAKMATAFMAEPTTSINMIVDALRQGRRGNKRFAGKAIGAVAASMILNAILVSFVYAGRDDDEDKTYWEKYTGTLVEELIDSFNPLTMIPFVRDIVSICQGYDVERSDMAVFTDLYTAWNKLSSDKLSPYRKVEDFGGAVAALFGLPVKNIMRDVRGMYNTVRAFLSGEETTGAGLKEAVREALPGQKAKSDGQLLYEAMADGDTAQEERIRGRFAGREAAESALRTALRENDPRIREAAACHLDGDVSGRVEIITDIKAEGVFSQDTLVAAVNNEVSAFKREIEKAAQAAREGDTAGRDKILRELQEKGYSRAVIEEYLGETMEEPANEKDTEKTETPLYTAADINTAFAGGDTETAKAIIGELAEAKTAEYLADGNFRAKYRGKTETYIRRQAEEKAKSAIRSAMTSYWKPLYKAAYAEKDAAEMRRIREILLASGVYGRAGDVTDTVQGWIKSE